MNEPVVTPATPHNAWPNSAALPGFRGLEHVAIVVPDLTEATSFFRTVLGWPVAFSAGPFGDPHGGDWMVKNFDLHPRSVVKQLAVVRSPLLNFELFEGSAPDQATHWPRLLDIGGLHLALYVDDIDAALDFLVAAGCESLGGIKPLGGPETGDGARFGHVRTPFGLYLELITYPNGREYEANASFVAFNPSAPDSLARAFAASEREL
ncbi:MAG: VOC family protein [Microbacteriaceae bacterium]